MDKDNDIIAETAARAGKEGNERFFAKLEQLKKEQEEEMRLLQDIWQRLGNEPDSVTDPQYQQLTKLLEKKGWL